MTPLPDIYKTDWTPIRNRVFEEELRDLKRRHSAALFLHLYDRAYHSRSRRISTTVAQLSEQTGFDYRTVQKCMTDIVKQGLIRQVSKGVKRSRTEKDVWEVPLASVDLREGRWVPIPCNLIQKYVREYPNAAVLLPLLLYFQNKSKLNYCWVGVPKLATLLKWSETRVRDSLAYMFNQKDWRSLHPDLPWPLQCKVVKTRDGQRRRQFTVRAIEYDGEGQKAVMRLSKEFRKAFDMI